MFMFYLTTFRRHPQRFRIHSRAKSAQYFRDLFCLLLKMSGVQVNSDCQLMFQEMVEKKSVRYVIFKIDDKEIIVEKAVRGDEMKTITDDYADNSKAAYEEFLTDVKTLTNNFADCRYAVFDFRFTTHREGAGAAKMGKIIFLQVCPDGAGIKRKMIYASSAGAMKQALGTEKIIPLQVSDESEMSHREVYGKLADKYQG